MVDGERKLGERGSARSYERGTLASLTSTGEKNLIVQNLISMPRKKKVDPEGDSASRPTPSKCGHCHTCLNPQLKKACITFRKEQGLPLAGKAAKKRPGEVGYVPEVRPKPLPTPESPPII